ncbi:MAG: Ig-like domain-containing protein, partial [Monoglobaceae bacterium]
AEIATAASLSSQAAKLTFQYTDSSTSSGTPSMTHTFDKVTSGKLKISYTIIPESGSALSQIVTKKKDANSDTNIDLIYFFYGQGGTPTISASTGDVYGQKIGNYAEGKTYKVDATIDIDAGTIERIVTDVADNTVVTKTTENYDIAEISGIKFANWKKDSTAGTYVTYIDDVKVEIYEELPSLSAEKVKIYDADSNVVSGTSNVPANISKIVLDFGAKLDADTVEGAITLKTAGGEAVNCTAAVDEADASKVNVTLNEILSFGTSYVLNVASTVENYIGGAMTTAFEYPFTTGAAVKTAKIASVSASALAEISANSTVTVTANVVNQGTVALPLTFIAAYFKGNQLVYCSIDDTKTADAGANGEVTSSLATPASMDGITSVEFYLWNTMSGMIPYDTAKIIGQ